MKSIVLTNATIENLLRNTNFLNAFPQLRGASRLLASARGCRCNRTVAMKKNRAINDFKAHVIRWDKANKKRLKKFLKADRIVLYLGKKQVVF